MQVIQSDNSWLQALGRWASLEEEARRRLTTEKLAQIEVARQMGDRKRFAELAGYNPQFTNPLYMEKPEISRPSAELSKLQSLGQTNMLGSVNDMTGNDVRGVPGRELRTVINLDEPRSWEEMTPQQQAEAKKQQGLDVLLSLKKAGQPIDSETISKIANMNAPGQSAILDKRGFNTGLKTESATAKENLERNIAGAKQEKATYDNSMQRYEASPELRKKYLTGETAGEMQQQIINALSQAVVGKSEPEIRRLYALANNAMLDTGVAYRRKEAREMLGGVGAWLPTGGGNGPGGKYWTLYDDSGNNYALLIPTGTERPYEYASTKLKTKIVSGGPSAPEDSKTDMQKLEGDMAREKALEKKLAAIDTLKIPDEEKAKRKKAVAAASGYEIGEDGHLWWKKDTLVKNGGGSSGSNNKQMSKEDYL